MDRLNSKQKNEKYKITFRLEAPCADHVSVAGDFNNWDTTSHPMKKTENGIWEKVLFLKEGSYEYKFFVDGSWEIDQKNERQCINIYGSLNNIVRVIPKR